MHRSRYSQRPSAVDYSAIWTERGPTMTTGGACVCARAHARARVALTLVSGCESRACARVALSFSLSFSLSPSLARSLARSLACPFAQDTSRQIRVTTPPVVMGTVLPMLRRASCTDGTQRNGALTVPAQVNQLLFFFHSSHLNLKWRYLHFTVSR